MPVSYKDWPAKAKFVDGLKFVGADNRGHSIVMDAPVQTGGEGSGFSPNKLMLVSLAGCTGMDVIHLLGKEGQHVSSLEVYVTGDQAVEFPHYFREVQIKYVLRGKNISREAVERAIRLSDEKYCSVGATFKMNSNISTSFDILDDA